MAAKNEITGDSIQSRGTSDAYRSNYDNIFRKKKDEVIEKKDESTMGAGGTSNEESEVR